MADGDTPDLTDLAARGPLPEDPLGVLPPPEDDFGPTDYPDMPRPRKSRANGKSNGHANGKNGHAKADPFAVDSFTLNPRREIEVADACIARIAEHAPDIFQRAGMLVRVVRDAVVEGAVSRSAMPPRIDPLPKPALRARLDALAEFIDTEKEKAVHPPQWVVDLVDAYGEWKGVRRLEGVVQTPVLRGDGTILDTPGYDGQTGLLYEPNADFPPVKPCPTREDAEHAMRQLLEVVAEFPFEQPKHRGAYLSLMLTPFARYAFHGPVPLGVIDGTVPGVGKGLLAQVIGILVDGIEIPPTPQPEQDDEERKLITSMAMAGRRLILIDNVTRPVGSGALEALLTSTRWSDRVLGVMKMWEGDVSACWLVTGNNVQFRKKDTIRRVVHVRLQSKVETPEARGGWRHPDLRAWVKRERGRLVAACLTILRAHALAGGPAGLTPWGSFEGWSNTVRSAVMWLGEADPADTRTELAEVADTETSALKRLLARWNHHQSPTEGMKCKDALLAAKDDDELADALDEICPRPPGKPLDARRLGLRMRDLKGRVVGVEFDYAIGGSEVVMMCLENDVDRKGFSTWRAVRVD